MILRAMLVLVGIALAEIVQGVVRVRVLNRRLGDRRARKVGVFAGSCMILGVGWFSVPWIGPASAGDSLLVGGVWLVLMVAFDVAVGRFTFRLPWHRIAADFDVRRGNLLALGMLVLFLTPLLVGWLRGLY